MRRSASQIVRSFSTAPSLPKLNLSKSFCTVSQTSSFKFTKQKERIQFEQNQLKRQQSLSQLNQSLSKPTTWYQDHMRERELNGNQIQSIKMNSDEVMDLVNQRRVQTADPGQFQYRSIQKVSKSKLAKYYTKKPDEPPPPNTVLGDYQKQKAREKPQLQPPLTVRYKPKIIYFDVEGYKRIFDEIKSQDKAIETMQQVVNGDVQLALWRLENVKEPKAQPQNTQKPPSSKMQQRARESMKELFRRIDDDDKPNSRATSSQHAHRLDY